MVYFRLLGRFVLRLFLYLGELASLVGQICESLLQGRKRWRQFFEQIVEIGYRSQAVVVITGAFTGAVLATQALFQFALVDMETMGGYGREALHTSVTMLGGGDRNRHAYMFMCVYPIESYTIP